MRKVLAALASLALLGGAAFAAEPKTDEEKTLYVMGQIVGLQLGGMQLSPEEAALVAQGLEDALLRRPAAVDPAGYSRQKIELLRADRRKKLESARKVLSDAFVAEEAKKPGAQKTVSGSLYFELQPGTGDSPAQGSTVKVHYRGTLFDGGEFDSSYKRGKPAEFPLNAVIPCWTEGVMRMKVGGKARLVCPPEAAYGSMGQPGIPGNSALVFEVELLAVK